MIGILLVASLPPRALISMGFTSSAVGAELPLTIEPGVAPAPSSVSVEITAPLFRPAQDSSSLAGTANLVLGSATAPFEFAQLTDVVVELTDGMDLRLQTIGLAVTATAAPGATRVRMIEPGPAGTVVNGRFDQLENLFEFEGEIMLSTEESPFDLSQVAPISADLLGIELVESQGMILTQFDIDLLFTAAIGTVIGQIPIDIQIDGSVRGTSPASVPGDLNGDGQLDASDIDAIYAAIRNNAGSANTDLNQDGTTNQQDVNTLVIDLLGTYFGDANLDREFNSGDLVAVFQLGEYEDGQADNSTWISGDWDGDGEFTSGDFVIAFQGGGFEQGPRAAVVPEPHTACWLLAALGWLLPRLRRSI